MATLTLNNLLADSRVTQDKGVNGVTMAKWLQGNSSLIPQLASLGYSVEDLVNEAYSQTRTNRSAFSGDMTTTPRANNKGTSSGAISEPVNNKTTTNAVTPAWKQPLLNAGYTEAQIKSAFGDSNPTIDANGNITVTRNREIKNSAGKVIDTVSENKTMTPQEYMVSGKGSGFTVSSSAVNQGSQADTTSTNSSLYDTLIKNSPFLSEQFTDANTKSQFDNLPDDLKMSYIELLRTMEKTVEAGKVINPNIEITPEKIAEFTSQATSELDPYYQEQIKGYKQDLDTSISRLTEDFNTGVRNAEDPFKKNLAKQAENEAQAGLTYGSERGVRQGEAVTTQQQAIDELAKTTGRTIEDNYTTAERKLGSDVLGTPTATLPSYGVSTEGFTPTSSRTLFTPTGGLIGSLQKEKATAIGSRTSELEKDYREKRILNTSQL